jgi:small subunit ribosomal protein S20
MHAAAQAEVLACTAKIAYYARSSASESSSDRSVAATAASGHAAKPPVSSRTRHRMRCRSNQESDDMANTAQARKRARQAEATRQRNASQKSALRTAVKKVKKAIATGDKAAAAATFQTSQAVIDRVADKRIVHKNLASRTKSRLAQAIKAMA